MAEARQSPAAHHTLRILGYLSAQRGPVPAATITTALGLPRSTVYRLLGVMEQHGFVIHYPEVERYGIGLAAFELSSGFARQEPLARLGAPILAALVDRVRQSAHLSVLHGRDVIYLVEERAPGRPPLVTNVGVRLPSHITASGRAQLAALPDVQLRALFPNRAAFAGRAEGSPTRLSELRAILIRERRQGYALEDGEVTEGLVSVAVAIRDRSGWPIAGIAVTYPQVPAPDRPHLVAEVRHHANELARRIRGQKIL
ncbi:IclR family transcriptional regulator [Actinoplanes oblitus]|uniref:IclR family transcriptional regulator n=1 Tax=Actinoplanes oblitus TaxID=3040509 RepID=A0ABY8W6X4_9ACTN|nr:IclR family transcriptional regulator [Actinoplanes oblitus]WIM92778.1 IclR family transcriptional regulator [Actinoplanes oblitus]